MDVLDILLVFSLQLMLCAGGTMSAEKQKKSHNIHLKMNDIELQRYFGVSSFSNVPEYEIAFPKHANEKGQEISSHRSKRDIEETGLKYYHVNAFDNKLHLNVSLNKRLLGPGFHVETRHKDGSKTINDAPHRNFYHGHVVGHPGSFVALSDDNGVSGAIRFVDDEMLFMEPVPRHLLDRDYHDGHHPHLVVKKTENDFQRENKMMFDSEKIPQRHEAPFMERGMKSDDEIDDDKNGHRFYEIIYVGDHLIAETIGLMELPDMLLIIANIVSRMYTDSSFGEIKLHYVVTKVLILNNGELNYDRSASMRRKIDVFGKWLKAYNPESDDDPRHVDAGTLFTSFTGGGLALSGGMCNWRSMPCVVGQIGLSSSAIAAHENFHNLGYGHDVDYKTDECPNGANIMSTYVPSGKACFIWSNCSRRWVQDYLRHDRSFCLRDAPKLKPPAIPPYIKHNLPGTIFDGNKQCQYKLGNPAGRQCITTCGPLYCDGGGGCWWSGGAPAEGTACGKYKWCIRGECVDNGSPPVDGNWGSWSEYSECSRTCGVGIQYRSRECDNPSPKRGGKPCPQASKNREDRTCNTHACPSSSNTFRKMQCKDINVNYTYYIRKGAECWRWCRPISKSWVQLYGQVRDGTRCYADDDDNQDICVQGECKRFGCDKQLNGDEIDRCGECAGDGSRCELRVTNYTKIHLKYGKDNADTMLTLKKGYSNVHAKMNGANRNIIAVQDINGKYIMRVPSRTKTIKRSGMKITYIRESNEYRDEIIIPGLVTKDLKLVFVHFRGRNQGVVIRYNVPADNPVKPSSKIFHWKAGEWSTCSKTCAGGISTRDVTCSRNDDNTLVGIANCPQHTKPAVEQICNAQDCPAEWYSYLTACTKTCGKGTQHKKIECRRLAKDHYRVVSDLECTETRPTVGGPELTYCNEIACPPIYKLGPWSKCSTTCGLGIMTRPLQCQMTNDQGGITFLPTHTCEHYGIVKPPTEGNCNFDMPCIATPKYTSLGCFKDDGNNRTLPKYLKNLRPLINWRNLTATIEACAKLAQEHNVEYFGIQFYGECYAAKSGTVPNYAKYGPASNCVNGVGANWSNYVYKMITGSY